MEQIKQYLVSDSVLGVIFASLIVGIFILTAYLIIDSIVDDGK